MNSAEAAQDQPDAGQVSQTRSEQLREGLACALMCIEKVEKGRLPERGALEIAVTAAQEKRALESAPLRCALLDNAGLKPRFDAAEERLHRAIEGTLLVIAAVGKHREVPLKRLKEAVETALEEDALDIDQLDTALTRKACGEAFARKATAQAHAQALRGGREGATRHEAAPRKARPWVEKHERERLEQWLGARDPKPHAVGATEEGPGMPSGAEEAIEAVREAIEEAERRALTRSDIVSGVDPERAGARGAGEDLYTRRARLERLRWRVEDARRLLEQGRRREAWQVAVATRHRVATADQANETLLRKSSCTARPS